MHRLPPERLVLAVIAGTTFLASKLATALTGPVLVWMRHVSSFMLTFPNMWGVTVAQMVRTISQSFLFSGQTSGT
jgi:hypothetical protein